MYGYLPKNHPQNKGVAICKRADRLFFDHDVYILVPGVGYANLNPDTNLGAWLDRLVFGTNHLWRESRVWDPEGILGTIPAIATGLFGIRVGTWL